MWGSETEAWEAKGRGGAQICGKEQEAAFVGSRERELGDRRTRVQPGRRGQEAKIDPPALVKPSDNSSPSQHRTAFS